MVVIWNSIVINETKFVIIPCFYDCVHKCWTWLPTFHTHGLCDIQIPSKLVKDQVDGVRITTFSSSRSHWKGGT